MPKTVNLYVEQNFKLLEFDQQTLQTRRSAAQEAIKKTNIERDRVWKLNAEGLLFDVHLTRRLSDLDKLIASSESMIADIDNATQRVVCDKEAAEHARSLI